MASLSSLSFCLSPYQFIFHGNHRWHTRHRQHHHILDPRHHYHYHRRIFFSAFPSSSDLLMGLSFVIATLSTLRRYTHIMVTYVILLTLPLLIATFAASCSLTLFLFCFLPSVTFVAAMLLLFSTLLLPWVTLPFVFYVRSSRIFIFLPF